MVRSHSAKCDSEPTSSAVLWSSTARRRMVCIQPRIIPAFQRPCWGIVDFGGDGDMLVAGEVQHTAKGLVVKDCMPVQE